MSSWLVLFQQPLKKVTQRSGARSRLSKLCLSSAGVCSEKVTGYGYIGPVCFEEFVGYHCIDLGLFAEYISQYHLWRVEESFLGISILYGDSGPVRSLATTTSTLVLSRSTFSVFLHLRPWLFEEYILGSLPCLTVCIYADHLLEYLCVQGVHGRYGDILLYDDSGPVL